MRRKSAFKHLFFAVVGLLGLVCGAGAEVFERPAELEPDIEFWRRVYTEITTRQGFIHDNQYLNVVYTTIDFPEKASRSERERRVEAAKRHYSELLRRLSSGSRHNLSEEELRVLQLWGEDVENRQLREGMERLRFQLGQADKFREGLMRSGRWEPYIRETFERMGLPVELAVLPHVESSFNPGALSHVGATGLWQFTRDTGRRFMRIDHVVDERLDPYRSTVAAARLLQQNYNVTGTWPLALTAYNHGAAGMRRARQQLGTTDIARIAREYRGRTFGFASRNFYVAFLAALDVTREPDKYFGPLRREPAERGVAIELPDYISIASLETAFGVDRATLRRHNPALLPSVWSGNKHVPRGYELRLPLSADVDPEVLLASIPGAERFAAQTPDLFHTVQRGDTLSAVAARYGVSINDLVAMNSLPSQHRIRIGQVLRLPTGGRAPVLLASATPVEDGVYVVQRGDSLSAIARRMGTTEENLLAANDIRNRNWIYEGQRLRVHPPQPDEAPAPASAETLIAAATPAEPASEPPAAAAEAGAEATLAAAEPPAVAADEAGAEVAEGAGEAPITIAAQTGAAVEAEAAAAEAEPQPAAAPEQQMLAAAEAAEPTMAEEVPAPLAAAHSSLAADPSDYSVSADGTIEIQAAETLGHYAEWLDLRASRLRQINRMSYGTPVVVGRRLKMDLSRVDGAEFEHRRTSYHRALQEQFFSRFRIAGTQEHVVRAGESLWVLSHRRYEVPVWLLRQYNPDLDLAQVQVGTRVIFPVLESSEG